jgi:hypothetical protein
VVSLRGDEEYTCACSFEVQGTIEVHLLVLQLLRRWGLLGLRPFRDEVCEVLKLDGLSWTGLKLKLA